MYLALLLLSGPIHFYRFTTPMVDTSDESGMNSELTVEVIGVDAPNLWAELSYFAHGVVF
jgi:hypothetical protein